MKISKMEIAKNKIQEIRGKARERIVNGSDLDQVLIEAHDTGWGYTAGGTVANAYKYPVQQMRLAAIKSPTGHYQVYVDWGNAHKSSSCLPHQLPRQYQMSNEKFGEILNKWAISQEAIDSALIIPRAEVNRLIRERKQRASEIAAEAKRVQGYMGQVTRDDSLSAGNCTTQTDNVILALGGRTSVSVAELRNVIATQFPSLTRYAERAIAQAAKHN
jgi:hypothetical protein